MKLFFNPILFFLIIFLFENSAYSLSEYQIRQRCQNKSKRSTCIKNLKFKKLNLLQGEIIEIPVITIKK
tara:strand:- start:227 stop:433 length:207 start_codon:yes stop_codon:yes gene_type:complete